MTWRKREIMDMAREVGFEGYAELTWEGVICTEELVAFAKLVREDEREACAKVADHYSMHDQDTPADIAEAIRARGQA
jgi:hypothetical protein